MEKLPVSEQLIATVVGVVVILLIQLVPDLAPLEDSLAEIAAVFASYILGKSGVEAAKVVKNRA